MRSTFTICLVFFLSISYLNILQAQPPQYGCHLLHYSQSQRVLTEAEKAEVTAGIERSDSFDIQNYEITADLTSFSSQRLKANTIVEFSPKLEGLSSLRLDLEGLTVDSILFHAADIEWTHDGRFIDIAFAEALNKNQEYSIQVFYHGTPIICDDDGFGGFYFENDVAYNLGIGIDCIPHNYGRAWFPCFDNFVEHSTYKYNIISHKGRIGYGLGHLVHEETLSGDTIRREFVLDQPIPTYLSHIAVGPYTEVNSVLDSEFKPIPFQLVVKPKDSTYAKKHFEHIGEALKAMEYWYGPYIWEMVGYHMTGRGAMEHPTGIAYPEGILRGTNLGLQTHELTHHWWGNAVTLETDADMWIKEGPAAYSEQQIIEYMDGDEKFQDAVKLNNYNMVNTAHIADDGYLPLSPMPQRITYGVHTYNKGAAMFHNMRTYLGDSLFRVGMQYVIEENMYGNINAYSFRDQLITATSVDMTDFFNDWILSPGWSDFAVNGYEVEQIGSQYKSSGQIIQSQYHSGHYHENVPVQLSAYFKDFSKLDTVVYASGHTTDFTYTLDEEPLALIVNADYTLCLASFTSSQNVTGTGTIRMSAIDATVHCSEYENEDFIAVEHHYTAPPAFIDNQHNIELSETHYWKVALMNPGNNVYGFNYRYSASDTSSLDYDIARDGIDSLLLLYREDIYSDWVEAKDYSIVKSGSSSGTIVNRNLKSGLYTLGHGRSNISTSVKSLVDFDINLYPTVIDQSFIVEGAPQGNVEVYSVAGLKIGSYELNSDKTTITLPAILPGMYIARILDTERRLLTTEKIIKK